MYAIIIIAYFFKKENDMGLGVFDRFVIRCLVDQVSVRERRGSMGIDRLALLFSR